MLFDYSAVYRSCPPLPDLIQIVYACTPHRDSIECQDEGESTGIA